MNIPLCDIKPKVIPDKKAPFGIPVMVSQMSARMCHQCFDYAMNDEDWGTDCSTCGYKKMKYGYLYDVIVRFGTTYGIIIFESGSIERVPVDRIIVLDVPRLSIDPIKDGDEL